MYWIFGVKFIDLGDSCVVGGDPAMNIIIACVPAPENECNLLPRLLGDQSHHSILDTLLVTLTP